MKKLIICLFLLAIIALNNACSDSVPTPVASPESESYASSLHKITIEKHFLIELMFLKTDYWKGPGYAWKHESGAPEEVIEVDESTYNSFSKDLALSSLKRDWGFFDTAYYWTIVEDKQVAHRYQIHLKDGRIIEVNEPTALEVRLKAIGQGKSIVEADNGTTKAYYVVTENPKREDMVRFENRYSYKVNAKIWSETPFLPRDFKKAHKDNTCIHYFDIGVPESVYKSTGRFLWVPKNKFKTRWKLDSTVKIVGEKYTHYNPVEDQKVIIGYDANGNFYEFPKS